MSATTRHRKISMLLDADSDMSSSQVERSSEADVPANIPHYDGSDSDSPSEHSPKTPDDTPVFANGKKRPPPLRLISHGNRQPTLSMSDSFQALPLPPPIHPDRPTPSPKPVLQSSLTTLSDWNYDRYSTVIEPSRLQAVKAKEEALQEPCSPIEVATPVSYQRAKVRPALIKLINIGTKSKSATPSLGVTERPRTAGPSSRPFPAAEATPVDFSSVRDVPVVSTPHAHRASSSQLLTSVLRPHLQRKSSEPLLSTTFGGQSKNRTSTLILGSIPGGPLSSHPGPSNRVSSMPNVSASPPPLKPRSRLRQISNPRAQPSLVRNLDAAAEPSTDASGLGIDIPRIVNIQQAPINPFSYTPTVAATSKPADNQSDGNSGHFTVLHVARKKSMSALTQTIKHAKTFSMSRLSISQSKPELIPSVPTIPNLPPSLTIITTKANRDVVRRRIETQPELPPTPKITDTKAIWMGNTGDHGLSRKKSTGRRRTRVHAGSDGTSGGKGSDDKTHRIEVRDWPTPPIMQGSGWGSKGSSRPSSRPASSHLQ